MTPQSPFMVVAPIAAGKEAGLRATLQTMNLRPGVVNPHNPLVPFARLERLHFARFVILDHSTAEDILAYGFAPNDWPNAALGAYTAGVL